MGGGGLYGGAGSGEELGEDFERVLRRKYQDFDCGGEDCDWQGEVKGLALWSPARPHSVIANDSLM